MSDNRTTSDLSARADEELNVARRHLYIALGAVCLLDGFVSGTRDAAINIKAALRALPVGRLAEGRHSDQTGVGSDE